ncbi:MAG TPA: ABC transporter transmembrane domain-containing protein [Dongiaceae bacterium]|nr:ABC transporter transmembrane domain-containing protein [Dongiaceae bacterium]
MTLLSGMRDWPAVKALFRFVWRISARDQIALSILAALVFLVDLIPLELQRRITNAAVDKHDFKIVVLYCAGYAVCAAVLGGLKFAMSVYRGAVTERTNRDLRLDENLTGMTRAGNHSSAEEEGVAISVVVSEVESVGGFVASSISEPVLDAGILLSIFGYMLVVQPWLALVALMLFVPQVSFIPLLQDAINRRTQRRIKVVRKLSVDIVEGAQHKGASRERTFKRRARRVYDLNMQIYRRKFGMNFLMNLFYHLGIVGILLIGSWQVIRGETEIGTVVAFISGLNRMNDPWGDLVNYFRDLTNAAVKYRLIARVIHGQSPAG